MTDTGDIKRVHSSEFKTNVVLDLLKETDTLPRIASRYGIHPTQARRWREIAIATLKNVFAGKPPDVRLAEKDERIEELTKLIGQKEIELDWVKKKSWTYQSMRRAVLLKKIMLLFSIRRQCGLLGLNRSGFYYARKPEVSFEDKIVMDYLDQTYIDIPFYGVPRMTLEVNARLEKAMRENKIDVFALPVNHKRIYRLMRMLGMQALRPKPKLSIPNKDHVIYPYLLKDIPITHPNHVWSIDITYIKLQGDWMYLVAIIDWYSRFILGWELSDTMSVDFCVSSLEKAFTHGLPEIHNSDQGSQMTSKEYLEILQNHPTIRISMDHKGRCFDNIFIERFWRSFKYEEVYLKEYQSPREARESITAYMDFYNYKRFHQSLNYKTPASIYFGRN